MNSASSIAESRSLDEYVELERKIPLTNSCSSGADSVLLVGDLVLHIVLAPFLSWVSTVRAQAQLYVGVLGGLSTLSGDARSVLRPGSSAFSSYDPENGGAFELLLGRHFSDHFTIRADYIWNRNELTLTSAAFDNGTQQGYQATRRSSQQSAIADLLVYVRERDSRLRPYLVSWGWVSAFRQLPRTA